MSDDNNKSRILPISGLFLMFAALSVIIFNKAPFEESRPPVPEIHEPFNQIKARLWQDPFLAVLHDAKTRVPPSAGGFCPYSSCYTNQQSQSLANQITEKRSKGKMAMVGVMVFGAPYAEEGEQRIRNRYAALSAFHRLGFVPDDPEHIEYVRILHERKSSDRAESKLSMTDIMPFEWLKNVSNENDSILLLWINDDVFQKNPLTKLRRLSQHLLNTPIKACSSTSMPFKVIGPAGSTTLKEMLLESKNQTFLSTKPKESLDQQIEIYSPTATVDDSNLLQMFGDSNFARDPSRSVEAKFKKAGFNLHRTICSDRELAEKISKELRLRGIDCREKRNHIVLLSEWDTYYGRSLTEIYKWVFFHDGVVNVDKQIHTFSFIRGLDGKIPGEKGAEETSEEKKDTAKTKTDPVKELEHATGKSQFDYIRRLADEIYYFEQQLEGGGSIRAIGVLGTDFHDKYLLLQALRQRFPQTVFFTTDLDARLLHPDALQWTRNLLVASSFNLELRNDKKVNVQGDVPPFRDSYQTSIFFALLQSFAQENYLDPKLQDVVLQKPRPKIFEIGRYRAVDLSEDPNEISKVDPRHQEANSSKRTLRKVIMICLLLVVLLYFSSDQVRALITNSFSGKKRAAATLVSLSLLTLSMLAFYHVILLNPHKEEPLSFVEGISIWPNELLRLFAVLLSLFLIWRANTKIRENTAAICMEFGFHSPLKENRTSTSPEQTIATKDKTGIPGDIIRMFRKFSDVIRYDWSVEKPVEDMTIDYYWSEYCRRDSCQYRIRRLTPIIFSYIAMSGLIISFSRPEIPVRGSASIVTAGVILGMSVLASIILIFYTFDVIRTCHRFTNLLVEQAPQWSDQSFSSLVGQHTESAKKSMREWMLIHLIARRTETVGKIIFYPFIVWFILFFARLNYFDNWRIPIGLAVVLTLGAVYAWSCALVLRRSAEHARHAALDRLTLFHASVVAEGSDEKQLKRIEFATDSVKSISVGAFAPFTQNPVVQALMVPFGGVGGLYIFDILGKLNI